MPHDRETFVRHLMHSGRTDPDGRAYNGAYLVEDCSTPRIVIYSTSCTVTVVQLYSIRVGNRVIYEANMVATADNENLKADATFAAHL